MAVATAKKTSRKKPKQQPVFNWEGTDKRGAKVKGSMHAENPLTLKAELRRQGIIPIKVRRRSPLEEMLNSGSKKIKPSDIAYFSRQLATMLQSGVPLVQALDIVGKGDEHAGMRELVGEIKNDVESGTALHVALQKHPRYFDDLFVSLVAAGESAGVLDTLLDKIATYKEKTESIKGKIKKALFYPTAVIVVAIVVTAILLIWVVPQFESLFRGFGADLPLFTQMVINLSDFMQSYWFVMLAGAIGLGWAFSTARRKSKRFAQNLDRFSLKIPAIGTILYKAAVARFARTLATMFAAGVPLVEGLRSVASATGNYVFESAVLQIREQVAAGQQLQISMRLSNVFPNMAIQMVSIGEESGSLDSMLSKVADYYEEEVDNAIDSLSSLLEPMIMAILGVLVGGLVIAMYLPIFQMGSAI
ncbi:type IV pilus assembly protein PilC [Alkalispirillum mobile]|uniref:Type IV pilus assembly protein PilC n=1 Tax=Alkalispirillum mobile TaxID=85925 RepID=A0A498C7M7_9GAMM|nr:type II secretion system F family protein [Alkalispirillum mobile]RLK48578.1 type IV pilus assembly protein PilC [Alkalispirillum mobile]